jgi:uncharacterized protein involved in exopolysaccharide biosynthesis
MPENDQLTIPEIVRIVKRDRSLIFFFSAVIFLGVLIGNIVIPSSFIAQATLFSMEGQGIDTGFTDLKTIPRESEKNYSPLVPILAGHKITENITGNIGVENIISKPGSADQIKAKDILLQKAAEYLYKKTRIFSRGNLIYILVDWKDPGMAETLANAYIDSLASLLNQQSVPSKYFMVDRAVHPENNIMLKQINIVLGFMMSVFLAAFGIVLRQYLQRLRNG